MSDHHKELKRVLTTTLEGLEALIVEHEDPATTYISYLASISASIIARAMNALDLSWEEAQEWILGTVITHLSSRSEYLEQVTLDHFKRSRNDGEEE